jgi:hypothetical protein
MQSQVKFMLASAQLGAPETLTDSEGASLFLFLSFLVC